MTSPRVLISFDSEACGKLILASRNTAKLTQAELAGRARISQFTISRMEAGDSLSEENLRAVLKVLVPGSEPRTDLTEPITQAVALLSKSLLPRSSP
jgi:predicted transcriptional regulator